MTANGWLQLAIYIAALALITKPLGLYLVRVLTPNGKTFLDVPLGPVERLFYKLFRIDPHSEQDWKQYTVSLLMFSVVGLFLTYVILRLQHILLLNPQNLGAVSDHLSFNTAVSFTTNTNWQSYGGESTMSYLSQMVALTFHNFMSAATGIAVAAALVRGIARSTTKTIGNFWVDMTRVSLYLLLPLCLVLAVFYVSQGMIMNFKPYESVHPVQGMIADTVANSQSIVQGPMASEIAIKMLGTNGGGYVNANAAHPYKNPNPLSNFIQILTIFAIGSALTYYLGRMVKNQKHGWSVWAAMMLMFLVGTLVLWNAEVKDNPRMTEAGVTPGTGNMEGKEVRFGLFNTALFATITTDASCGAVNGMHDSFMPLGGLIPMFNMQVGEVIIGGVGAGMYGMLLYVVLAIFIAGLMVGRTPEYLGKKIQATDVKLASIGVLVPVFSILCFTAWGVISKYGVATLNNTGPHGFSEILYAFSSATANNGSAFAGLGANNYWYDITLALAMLIGRFGIIVPVMALAGSLASKNAVAQGVGSFPVSGVTFAILLIGTVIIVGALNFIPALTLGPIVEHFILNSSTTLY